jgi:hypothetical protein
MAKDKVEKTEEITATEEPQPKADCKICGGKGFVDVCGITKVQCTCKYK